MVKTRVLPEDDLRHVIEGLKNLSMAFQKNGRNAPTRTMAAERFDKSTRCLQLAEGLASGDIIVIDVHMPWDEEE